jgi:rhamnose utilization protein RhaD (predicted bifunctional aldolase and dehydrogenase)
MKNLFNDINLRVFTSNLLGRDDTLVLHGGGNTSVKTKIDGEDILLVKGSGWDLVSIEAKGFAPVKMKTLLEMAKLDNLSDSDMVEGQKKAIIDKNAPNPSVEAILHALIPYKFVDHTHADAIVSISNSIDGDKYIKQLYKKFLIVPYVMPGFILAKTIYQMTKNLTWDNIEGIILHNHGIFTFDNDAKKSYTKMINAVSLAEDFLEKNAKIQYEDIKPKNFDISKLNIDKFFTINQSKLALKYVSQPNLKEFATRGVLTPEHIIRTKRIPLVLVDDSDIPLELQKYKKNYEEYFNKFSTNQIMLDPNPKYIVIKDFGIISFAKTQKEADIINDIVHHTIKAVLQADMLGGYKSISIKESFDMEYWELEQAKLKKGTKK